ALAPRPSVVLLDEPFSALDVDLRQRLAHEVAELLRARGVAAVHVTHDPAEASAIADHVLRFDAICR
ncbi:MAG: iron ABC transporter ATP-binding protein, partial [Actinomycetes bacterium]